MDAQQRSWLGSLGATFVKMSSPLTLDKPANVDHLNILLKRELHNCIIDESNATTNKTYSLFSIFPKLQIQWAVVRDLQINTDSGPVLLYAKGRWNISHFRYPDDKAEGTPLHLRSSEPNPNNPEDATSDEVTLDQDIEAAWVAGPNNSLSYSDSETDTEDNANLDDHVNDPDFSPSSSDISDSSGHPTSHASTTAIQTKNVSPERQFTRFLNALVTALHTHVVGTDHSYPIINGFHTFSAAFSTSPIFHALGPRKPDLIVIESKQEPLLDDISWEDPKLIMELTEEEYTPTSRIATTLHSKAYLMLCSQLWHRFVLGFQSLVISCASIITIALVQSSLGPSTSTRILAGLSAQSLPPLLLIIFTSVSIRPFKFTPLNPQKNPAILLRILQSKSIPDVTPDIQHVPLLPDLPTDPIGWVLGPDGEKYDILKMVWASQGLVGRGTACYCVRDPKTGEIFTLKDYRVDNSQLKHESDILERLRGIQGIPIKIKAWNVQFQGVADSTMHIRLPYKHRLSANMKMAIGAGRTHRHILMSPFTTSIVNLGSVEELVSAICDIIRAHAQSLRRGVLHRDISINNLMLYWSFLLMTIFAVEDEIEESESTVPVAGVTASQDAKQITYGSHLRKGLLVDFDYAMLTDGKTFTFKGTGTLPFVSYRILQILQRNAGDESGRQIVDHRPEDDLESLFYVMVWICMLYDGPNNTLRTDVTFAQTPLFQWAEHNFACGDFAMCSLSKFQLMTSSDTTLLTDHITPYFKCLIPYLIEWRNGIGKAFDNADNIPPLHDDILVILNKALENICIGNTTRTIDPSNIDPHTEDTNHHPQAAHTPPTIDSSDVDPTTSHTEDVNRRPQAAWKRAKRPIPPSDRQLRSGKAVISLSETLIKRVHVGKKYGAEGGRNLLHRNVREFSKVGGVQSDTTNECKDA
ncbi:hypothetical protein JVT61DRAFT_9553 [Boletus reticuloceps]|uniref:Fungal-type protein kinase domain-containing protein n=1 Tax=Boletus reticuloceps TaxID=495285 RepID=A0A8I2YG54_9AGAM|nr:hypothetical protein JVT61DRAFT_9553 [Boletus reticuloceps]